MDGNKRIQICVDPYFGFTTTFVDSNFFVA